MTIISRACPTSFVSVQAGGDGSIGSAVAVDLPTQHTVVLVDLPNPGFSGIKLPEGNVGDVAEIYVISSQSTGATSKLRVYDADGYNLGETDEPGALLRGNLLVARKFFTEPYSAPSGHGAYVAGTWFCEAALGLKQNYPSS